MKNELQAVIDMTMALGVSFEALYLNRTLEQVAATKQAVLRLRAAIEAAEPYWSGYMPIRIAIRSADQDYQSQLRLNQSTLETLELIEKGEFFDDWQSEDDPAGFKFNASAYKLAAQRRQKAFDDTVKHNWL